MADAIISSHCSRYLAVSALRPKVNIARTKLRIHCVGVAPGWSLLISDELSSARFWMKRLVTYLFQRCCLCGRDRRDRID